MTDSSAKPAVLFLCTHNAGRSQMAMGFFKHLAGGGAAVYSGGSEPASEVNPATIAAMAEKGIDIAAEQPKRWTKDMLEAVDVVVTMGCDDTCPILPGRRYEEWSLPDPAGQSLAAVRPIRDEIEHRVADLLDRLAVRQGVGGDPPVVGHGLPSQAGSLLRGARLRMDGRYSVAVAGWPIKLVLGDWR